MCVDSKTSNDASLVHFRDGISVAVGCSRQNPFILPAWPLLRSVKNLWHADLMNWDQTKGNWKQFKGKAKEKWGKMTRDQLDQIEGKRDQLVGKIQKQYGISKEEAERQVGDWEGKL